jgi:hypothetical protein
LLLGASRSQAGRNNVIGEADPGFKPLPEDPEWVAKHPQIAVESLGHDLDVGAAAAAYAIA